MAKLRRTKRHPLSVPAGVRMPLGTSPVQLAAAAASLEAPFSFHLIASAFLPPLSLSLLVTLLKASFDTADDRSIGRNATLPPSSSSSERTSYPANHAITLLGETETERENRPPQPPPRRWNARIRAGPCRFNGPFGVPFCHGRNCLERQ